MPILVTAIRAKIASLLDAGARVKVVAPRALDSVRELACDGLIEWHEREFRAEDLDGVFLAIAGTADTAVNFSVFSEAERRGILCNAVDDPPNCDFYFGAVVKRGALQVAISSAGRPRVEPAEPLHVPSRRVRR